MQADRNVKLRWVTFWPVPYWTERFNVLARRPGIDLEVVFLSRNSALLPASVDEQALQFPYSVVREETGVSGYYQVNRRFPKPARLVGGDYDLLVMPYGDPDCIVASILCTLLNRRYCVFSPNNIFDWRPSSRFREILKRFIFGHASGVLVTGESQKEYASRYWKRADGMHIIGNPAPPLAELEAVRRGGGRASARSKLGWGSEFVLLYVGRLSREKGLDTLVTALDALQARGMQEYRAVIVGAGPYEAEFRRRVQECSLNVEFRGFVEGVGLTEVYIAADAFVLPSTSEPWGLVVNEAMEAGLPVVVSDRVGAQKALVSHGENGLVFPAGDAGALAECIFHLYTNRADLLSMSARSRDAIREHTLEKWADNVTAAVDMVVGGKGLLPQDSPDT